jgi:hypothetical protein
MRNKPGNKLHSCFSCFCRKVFNGLNFLSTFIYSASHLLQI